MRAVRASAARRHFDQSNTSNSPLMHLLVGTKKGLFIYSSTDRTQWQMTGPFLAGKEVHHAARDPRSGRIFATANDSWFGSEIAFSDDLGATWTMAKTSP